MTIDHHPHRYMARAFLIITILAFFLATLSPQIHVALFHGLLDHPYLSSMILVFGIVSLSLLWSAGQKIDAFVFLFFNIRGRRPVWLDHIMLVFTQLGSGAAGMVIAAVFYLVGDRRLAYEIAWGTLVLWIIVEIMKALFRRSRPFVRLTQTRIVGRQERGRSYPSGHTSQAFYMATLLSQHLDFRFTVSVSLYLVAVLVAVTRMYVGAHYPRDVLAGSILGGVLGSLGAIMDAHFFLEH
jgi:membrane-associated phospholipid phosphatase